MRPPVEILFSIRQSADHAIDEIKTALQSPLSTDSELDSPSARAVLCGAGKASRALINYLDANWEFDTTTNFAEPKEAE
jgi:hypothetical protein